MRNPRPLEFPEPGKRARAVDTRTDAESVPGGLPGAALPRRRALALLALAASPAVAAGWHSTLGYLSRDDDLPISSTDRRLPHPLRRSIPRGMPSLRQDVISAVVRKVRFRDDMHFSDLLHWLRVFSGRPDCREAASTVAAVLAEVTDARRLQRRFGRPSCLVPSVEGARYHFAPRTSREAGPHQGLHAYQALATFAEIGVGLGQPLRVRGGTQATAAALVRDLMANFQAREVATIEPDWAAVALFLYVPPERSWRNRWGERIELEDVANHVAGASGTSAACGGTHGLFAVAAARQVDQAHGFLSRESRARIVETLRAATSALESSQAPDGSWGAGWDGRPPNRPSGTWDAVHLTGHHLEWQSLLPPPEQAPRACLERALQFLAKVLLETSDDVVAQLYCPFSHAARVVLDAGIQSAEH